jgi:hypothetical protein
VDHFVLDLQLRCEESPKQKKSFIGEICWDEVILLLSLSDMN